jgi:hypothetical protein
MTMLKYNIQYAITMDTITIRMLNTIYNEYNNNEFENNNNNNDIQ